MRHMSANRQWKVVDERDSGNIFANDHWYSTHISCIVRVKTTQTTQKLHKTAQYCVNSYVKPSFELLKTRNRVKRRSGEHRRTTTEVLCQTNWWNAQIAHVSRKTRILCVIHAFTRLLGCVNTTLAAGLLTQFFPCCAFAIRSFSKVSATPVWRIKLLFSNAEWEFWNSLEYVLHAIQM